ncbi:hypothetical protein CWC22_018185 [Pseudoalteromonas rubra]|uniref:Uncharacterized protein n=1 Tax=Pseudoalteromonas rubra TaxID=43658 RepID=A0A7S7YWE6_9GAMM|nr:hypothetical protein [Pseudoalteromonas rubra]QPB84810.1 hypothetical protein CWC22_018185 [Pseudoalteromonas rubra]
MMKCSGWFATLLTLLLSGCQYSKAAPVRPALIEQTTPDMIREIQHVIVALKGGKAPKLANNVFMQRSTLFLEKGNILDAYGQPILGSREGGVTGFELQIRGEQCVLFYPKTGEYRVLPGIPCVPNPQQP